MGGTCQHVPVNRTLRRLPEDARGGINSAKSKTSESEGGTIAEKKRWWGRFVGEF